MMKKYEHCPICNSNKKILVAEETFKGKKYQVARCQSCSLLYTCYQEHDTNEHYKDDDYEKFEKKYGKCLANDLEHDRRKNYEEESSIIKSYITKGNYLDVGCNAGWLLGYVKKSSSLNLFGVEPSNFLAGIAEKRTGAKVFRGYLSKSLVPESFFDFVTLTDVFEHIPNPNEVLQTLHYTIKPGGHLMIKVPNGKFTYLKYRFRKYIGWALHPSDIFDAKEHLIHYDIDNLTKTICKNGFEITTVKVPLPIQTKGSPKHITILRNMVKVLAKAGFPPQDLMVIAKKI